jgi:WD40 repeat protein
MKYEYIHDALAKVVSEQVSTEVKARRKVMAMVKRAYQRYEERNVLLSEEDLLEIKPFRTTAAFSEKEIAFIKKSETAIAAAGRRKRLLVISIISLLSLAAIISYLFYLKASRESKIARSNEYAMAAIVNAEQDATGAFSAAMKAIELQDNDLQRRALYNLVLPRANGVEYPLYQSLNISKELTVVHRSPNEEYVLFVEDSLAHVYHVPGGVVVAKIPDQGILPGITTAMAFSHDGQYIGLALDEGSIAIWRFSDQQLTIHKNHTDYVTSIQFTKDDNWILTTSLDGQVLLQPIDADLPPKTVFSSENEIGSAVFTADESHLSIAYAYNHQVTALEWDAKDQTGVPFMEMSGFDGDVVAQVSHPFSDRILIALGDGEARTWNLESGEIILLPHEEGRQIEQAQFSEDGKAILTASRDGIIHLWREDGSLMSVLDGQSGVVFDALFTGNGLDVLARYKNSLKLWDGETGQVRSELSGFLFSVTDMTYLPSRDLLFSIEVEEYPKSWHLYRSSFKTRRPINRPSDYKISAFGAPFYAYVQDDYSVAIWDVLHHEYYETPQIADGISSLKIVGNKLFIGRDNGSLSLFDLADQTVKSVVETEASPILSIAISENQQYLITNTSTTATIWEILDDHLETLKPVQVLEDFMGGQFLHPSGNLLGYSPVHSRLALFDLATQKIQLTAGDSLPVFYPGLLLKTNPSRKFSFLKTIFDDAYLVDLERSTSYILGEFIKGGIFYDRDQLMSIRKGNITLWDLSNHPAIRATKNIFDNEREEISHCQLSADEQFAFMISNQGRLKIYRLGKGTRPDLMLVYETVYPNTVEDFQITPDDEQIIIRLKDEINNRSELQIYPFSLPKIRTLIQ